METNQRKFSRLKAGIAFALVALALLAGKTTRLAQGTVFTYQSWLNSATFVSNGLFMIAMDFENQFTGRARWLGIAIHTNGGGFLKLDPQQPLTSMPCVITAKNVPGGGISSGTYINPKGNLFFRSQNPQASVQH